MINFAARSAALVLLGAFTACSSGSFEGKLVDGLTGQPAAVHQVAASRLWPKL